MTFQPLDCRTCALAIHSALSSSPPSLGTISAEAGNQTEALGLLSQLLQHSFLNGTCPEDSVWTALDNLIPPSLSPRVSTATHYLTLSASPPPIEDGSCEPLDDGIEVVPHTVELVEIAIEGGRRMQDGDPNGAEERKSTKNEGTKWWEFNWRHGHNEETKEGQTPTKRVVIAKKIFHPPEDRLSVRATWWGYEIYLPEPVVSSGTVSPTDRASTDPFHPTSLLISEKTLSPAPPVLITLRGFPLLQSLVPIFSAIISAVTWYWKTIKKMDSGEWIILSATWVLPVAVVPRPLKRKRTGEEEVESGAGEAGTELGESKDEATESDEPKQPSSDAARETKRPNKLRRVLSRSRR
ncbi:uncharacterized protein JCM6883_007317 [Sporobolomyces salmoneus]|uniref:uncharacterized protein n=1 Tax=Sporobolomyces salmoneus TaxID=183962 RepID=UPI00316BAC91